MIHLKSWRMWVILGSQLGHKGILSSAQKAKQAQKILRKFPLCANHTIRKSSSGFRSKNEYNNGTPIPLTTWKGKVSVSDLIPWLLEE